MKYLIIIALFLCFSVLSYSQVNEKIIKSFNEIKFTQSKFDVEGVINSIGYYKITNRRKHLINPLSGFLIEGMYGESIDLLFNDGKLYFKMLTVKYSKSDFELLKKDCLRIVDLNIDSLKYSKYSEFDLNNKIYGGNVGVSFQFDIDPDPLKFQQKRISYSADLSVDYNQMKELYATLVGYELVIRETNLSGTGLNIRVGITTF